MICLIRRKIIIFLRITSFKFWKTALQGRENFISQNEWHFYWPTLENMLSSSSKLKENVSGNLTKYTS